MDGMFFVVIETLALVALVTILSCLIAVAAARFVASEEPEASARRRAARDGLTREQYRWMHENTGLEVDPQAAGRAEEQRRAGA